MTAVRKIVDSNTLTGIFDLPPAFKDKKIEVILFPVEESSYEKKSFPQFSMAQIENWAKTPEIQSLVGVLKGANLPASLKISDIREDRLLEKYQA